MRSFHFNRIGPVLFGGAVASLPRIILWVTLGLAPNRPAPRIFSISSVSNASGLMRSPALGPCVLLLDKPTCYRVQAGLHGLRVRENVPLMRREWHAWQRMLTRIERPSTCARNVCSVEAWVWGNEPERAIPVTPARNVERAPGQTNCAESR